jgi:alpha-D-ribose 1-methylphosphonate 5-triphosphate synthase subunit PhnI
MYVAVKGGEKAIDNAHSWLAEERRGDRAVPDLRLEQIYLLLSVAGVRGLCEGSF